MRVFLLLCLLAPGAWANPAAFTSSAHRTRLLELYTSEGCSSCPPAEAWLGGLRDEPALWRDFVPVAFHVNYWDRLGWPDRFASKLFTEREYAYAAAWGSGSVYTPCYVLDGTEWRGGGRPPAAAAEIAGVLTTTRRENGTVRVTFPVAASSTACVVSVAILGSGIVADIKAGENEGRTLRHDFVVLALRSAPLQNGVAEMALPATTADGVARRALAVWVTRRGDPVPLQATGGWLD